MKLCKGTDENGKTMYYTEILDCLLEIVLEAGLIHDRIKRAQDGGDHLVPESLTVGMIAQGIEEIDNHSCNLPVLFHHWRRQEILFRQFTRITEET